MAPPLRRRRLRVASSCITRATTMSPLLALSVRLMTTKSPSKMPASIMLSPWTSRTKWSPVPSRLSGTGIRSRSCWMASMGVPAAILPRMDSSRTSLDSRLATGAWDGVGADPSITRGWKARRPPAGALVVAWSGRRTTSRARARWARRRRKPRSSRAVISRWMPDLDARSSASFISSKEGDTPVSLIRSWMNMRSSCCLRVSMWAACSDESRGNPRTNHARSVDVPD